MSTSIKIKMKPPNTCAKTTRQLLARIYEKHLNYSQTDTIMYHLSGGWTTGMKAAVGRGPQETCSLEWEAGSAEELGPESGHRSRTPRSRALRAVCAPSPLRPADKTLTKQTQIYTILKQVTVTLIAWVPFCVPRIYAIALAIVRSVQRLPA